MKAYDPQQHLEEMQQALQIIPETERLIDQIVEKGYSTIIFVGIGGTFLAESQVLRLAKQYGCRLPVYLKQSLVTKRVQQICRDVFPIGK